MQSLRSSTAGFTLIEMIVSLAIFASVVTIAVGALLVLVATNDQLQGEQSVMTNLSFALDSMTREIRTGINYYCNSRANYTAGSAGNMFASDNNLDEAVELNGTITQDCHGLENNGHLLQGVAFIEGGDSITGNNDRVLYFFDRDLGQLFRRVGDEEPQQLVSDGVTLHNVEFFVTGSKKLSEGGANSTDQASVTIFIEASDANDPSSKRYQLQTTVTQRTLDI